MPNTDTLKSKENKQLTSTVAEDNAISAIQVLPAADSSSCFTEDGEFCFQALYAHLLIDMAHYTSNIDHLIHYSALVVNMFMHAATFTPVDGHGKAQLREFDNKSQLQYFRSQGNHIQASFFKEMTKTAQVSGTCRLPFNPGFIKLIAEDDFSKKFCAEIKKMDPKTGYPKPGKTVSSYVMTQIAHAGARKNNFSTLVQSMTQAIHADDNPDKATLLKETLEHILPPTQSIKKLTHKDCAARINALLTEFKQSTATQITGMPGDDQLLSHLLRYRINRVRSLQQRVKNLNLNHISIDESQQEITCLFIRLYKNCNIADDTYTEGVTNVLLSFFGGLVNHTVQQKGLRLHTERRQSFGALRPTLTDAGCLMLRLSLGTEPTVFDDIILSSLQQFDQLLGKFKFDQQTHSTVKAVFAYCSPLKEQEEGKRKPRDPDTYIRNVVRKDDRTLTTYRQAKIYIDKAYQSKTDANYLEQAMTNFLDQYVTKGNKIKPSAIVSGVTDASDVIQVIASPIKHVLQNTLSYAFDFVKKLEFKTKNEPLQCFEHAYLHSLLKLFNRCQEAKQLLTQINQVEASTFYYKATLLTDDILEYLISLDGLQYIRAALQNEPLTPIDNLRMSELSYVAQSLRIPQDQLQLFFTDSGQQAIATTLLTLSIELHGPAADEKTYSGDVFLFGKSYYEVGEFLKDCNQGELQLQIRDANHAKIIFIDISQLHDLSIETCPAMKALVIDMTHHPLLDQQQLKDMIRAAHLKNILVVLVESSLKHAQLGLDKYQAGKITVIASSIEKKLSKEATDLFNNVSKEAIHPATASYLSMVNTICRDKHMIIATPETPPIKKETGKTTNQAGLILKGVISSKKPEKMPMRVVSQQGNRI